MLVIVSTMVLVSVIVKAELATAVFVTVGVVAMNEQADEIILSATVFSSGRLLALHLMDMKDGCITIKFQWFGCSLRFLPLNVYDVTCGCPTRRWIRSHELGIRSK